MGCHELNPFQHFEAKKGLAWNWPEIDTAADSKSFFVQFLIQVYMTPDYLVHFLWTSFYCYLIPATWVNQLLGVHFGMSWYYLYWLMWQKMYESVLTIPTQTSRTLQEMLLDWMFPDHERFLHFSDFLLVFYADAAPLNVECTSLTIPWPLLYFYMQSMSVVSMDWFQ